MKRTIIIIVIGTLVLVAALWGASRHFGWFSEEIAEPFDTFVYDDTQPIDLKDKTKVFDLIVLDMSGSMDTIRNSVVDGFNTLLDGLKMAKRWPNLGYKRKKILHFRSFRVTCKISLVPGTGTL